MVAEVTQVAQGGVQVGHEFPLRNLPDMHPVQLVAEVEHEVHGLVQLAQTVPLKYLFDDVQLQEFPEKVMFAASMQV